MFPFMLHPLASARKYWSFRMIGINIVCVGNLKEKYWTEAVNEYSKRLSRFCKLSIYEIDESEPAKEMNGILKRCSGMKIALCIEGKEMSSEKLAESMRKAEMNYSSITFIIGSSTGLDERVKDAADLKLSFSPMTFPHQMMRVILLEQIYRAFTINNNIKYHK